MATLQTEMKPIFYIDDVQPVKQKAAGQEYPAATYNCTSSILSSAEGYKKARPVLHGPGCITLTPMLRYHMPSPFGADVRPSISRYPVSAALRPALGQPGAHAICIRRYLQHHISHIKKARLFASRALIIFTNRFAS